MALPSISVCIPTRNRAESLRSTLAAMQAQTRPYSELIVGDDASEDNTREVVESFRDARIRYVRHQSNVGIYSNWNALIGLCSGDYICIYHDHDEYLHTILEYSARLLDLHEEMSFVHTALTLIDGVGNIAGVDIRPLPEVMTGTALRLQLANDWHSPIMAATAMVRGRAYRAIGPYMPDRYGLECDKHMWFRLAGAGTIGYIRDPQVNIRTRERGVGTAKFNWQNVFGNIRMRQEEIIEVYGANRAARVRAERSMQLAKDGLLLQLSLRALLLDPPNEWTLQEERVMRMLRSGPRLVYRAARASRLIQWLLRRTALRFFYMTNELRANIAKRRGEIYRGDRHTVPS